MKKPWHWKKEQIGQSHLRWIELLLYYLLWNGNHLIIWFSILQMRTRNLWKKAKRRRKTMMCPPKMERRSHTIRRGVYHNRIFICIYVILPHFYCFMLAGIWWEEKEGDGKWCECEQYIIWVNHLMSRHHELDSVLISLQTFEKIESLEIEVKVRMTFMLV